MTLHMTMRWEPLPGEVPGRWHLDCACKGAHGRWLIRRQAGRESIYVVRLEGEEKGRYTNIADAKAFVELIEQGQEPPKRQPKPSRPAKAGKGGKAGA